MNASSDFLSKKKKNVQKDRKNEKGHNVIKNIIALD